MAEREGGKSRRGFASMDPSKQRQIASKGGRAAHQKGTAHEFTSDEARVAGRKGGEAVSRNREHMSAIGRRGGEARGASRAPAEDAGRENGASRGSRGIEDREVGARAFGSQTFADRSTAESRNTERTGNGPGREQGRGHASGSRAGTAPGVPDNRTPR